MKSNLFRTLALLALSVSLILPYQASASYRCSVVFDRDYSSPLHPLGAKRVLDALMWYHHTAYDRQAINGIFDKILRAAGLTEGKAGNEMMVLGSLGLDNVFRKNFGFNDPADPTNPLLRISYPRFSGPIAGRVVDFFVRATPEELNRALGLNEADFVVYRERSRTKMGYDPAREIYIIRTIDRSQQEPTLHLMVLSKETVDAIVGSPQAMHVLNRPADPE